MVDEEEWLYILDGIWIMENPEIYRLTAMSLLILDVMCVCN